ncbi:MAG TPA: POTRA domain-containing protein, partial [Thermoanaerobaculia bacterium]
VDARFRRRYPGRWSWGKDEDDFSVSAALTNSGTNVAAPMPPAPATTAVTPADAEGTPIAHINFRADAPFDTSTLDRYITLTPGQPVSIREVQSSVKNLFASGNFRDIRVDAAPSPAGTVLTFSLFLHYRVGNIAFDGLGGRDRTSAERELTLRIGEVVSLDDVDDSATAIQQELKREGWLEATVDPETTFDRARSLADVVFHVATGPRAKIANVVIEGEPAPFTAQQLIKEMRRQPGDDFRVDDARRDAERMQTWLVRRDHRRADVDYLGDTYDDATDSVTLRYRVVTGPRVRVEVVGVDRGDVRRLLPFRARNQEYSEDVIDRAATNMVRAYQQRGYFHAAVDTESRLENGVWVTTFNVQPGTRYRLADVTFNGNMKVGDKALRGVVATSPRGGVKRLIASLFRRPTGVTNEQLSDDRDALESFYRLHGFSDATVGTPAPITRPNGTMTVDFPIVEGPQTIVSDITIEGMEHLGPRNFPRLQLHPGDPLNPQLERDDTVTLQTVYAERGYAQVQVSVRRDISPDKTKAAITYVLSEGPKVDVDEVIVRGNTYTDSEVILRTADLDPGDPFSYTSLLEAQRELYRLGIFQRVEIQPE